MKEHVIVSLRITVVLLVITCGIYPALVWAVGQVAFRHRANGSLITQNGHVIGSELIGQNFSGDGFFHPRPSAAGSDGYDPTASGGTNLGPTSKKLADAVTERTANWRTGNLACRDCPKGQTGLSVLQIPADAVTASASGLDPHISPENAMGQADRVARANGLPLERVQSMIRNRTEQRFLGVFGEPRVNVLLLNLDLAKAGKASRA